MSPMILPAAVVEVVRLDPAAVCRALRQSCATTQPDALAEAIDAFLAPLLDGTDAEAEAIYAATRPVLGTFDAFDSLDTARAAADHECELAEGPMPDEEAPGGAFDRWDAANFQCVRHHEAEWSRRMAAMLGAVEAALSGPSAPALAMAA